MAYDWQEDAKGCYDLAIAEKRKAYLADVVSIKAPFPYFGGKRDIAPEIWKRLGQPKQYLEPFAGSMAVLLQKPDGPAPLEVVGDANGFLANFWRAVSYQPIEVAKWADYPVSHIDQGARHKWLMERRDVLAEKLQDPEWPGDAQFAGWWLWGQCSWIGSGWCDWFKVSNAGREIQAFGKIPHVSDAGRGVQAFGKIPQVSNAGQGEYLTSSGDVAHNWLSRLSRRLERVRIIHGDWTRCLNHHYGGNNTAVVLDPPYTGFEEPYGAAPVAQQVAEWARQNQHLRIALCGHAGEHEMPGWTEFRWSRNSNTYNSTKTKDAEMIWFSPACIQVQDTQAQKEFDL